MKDTSSNSSSKMNAGYKAAEYVENGFRTRYRFNNTFFYRKSGNENQG